LYRESAAKTTGGGGEGRFAFRALFVECRVVFFVVTVLKFFVFKFKALLTSSTT
jgi:hypothetical protein